MTPVSSVLAVGVALACFYPASGIAQAAAKPTYTLPPVAAKADYQLGGYYKPASGVKLLARDRTETPAKGIYTICYINGFQTQEVENHFWRTKHPNLLLRDKKGKEITDPNVKWSKEIILDISTEAKRRAIAAIVVGWMKGCRAKGFKAVEFDNMDTFSRTKGRLKKEHALDLVKKLTGPAHSLGLAVGQKNSVEFGKAGKAAGMDFVVAENCAEWNECGKYAAVYGRNIIQIEYSRAHFNRTCKQWGKHHSIVLRDEDLSKPGTKGYVIAWCPKK